ncbi:hypothetical protein AMAG_10194 [Allomyces macrogynus ATCC 38327]|uniref:Uncharacterized protein n=1 Tax=Allomyces macrogynus (strain ATCC 38327) TaxID=578462 RepID=A0A0L0SR52_ALLM3|nr:hypothetical protein AMAG_10194 [Allomyces macrogynus ATCC 38327]|eukprot:KNE64859.1 hypothetical protein AMAG_10194 [Allomyces macrogynus ATCC 38327]
MPAHVAITTSPAAAAAFTALALAERSSRAVADFPDLSADFKFRLLFMFSSLIAAAAVLSSVRRLVRTLQKQSEEWSSSGSYASQLDLIGRSVEIVQALLFLVVDVLFLVWTGYPGAPPADAIMPRAALGLAMTVVSLDPGICMLVLASLLCRWFKFSYRRFACMVLIHVAPTVAVTYAATTGDFLDVQWITFLYVIIIDVLYVIAIRFFLFWITSQYPIMAYNEVNAKVIQGKVLFLYLSAIIDLAIGLLTVGTPTYLTLTINLFLFHIRFVTSVGLSLDMDRLERPVLPDFVGLVPEPEEAATQGLLRPRTKSQGSGYRRLNALLSAQAQGNSPNGTSTNRGMSLFVPPPLNKNPFASELSIDPNDTSRRSSVNPGSASGNDISAALAEQEDEDVSPTTAVNPTAGVGADSSRLAALGGGGLGAGGVRRSASRLTVLLDPDDTAGGTKNVAASMVSMIPAIITTEDDDSTPAVGQSVPAVAVVAPPAPAPVSASQAARGAVSASAVLSGPVVQTDPGLNRAGTHPTPLTPTGTAITSPAAATAAPSSRRHSFEASARSGAPPPAPPAVVNHDPTDVPLPETLARPASGPVSSPPALKRTATIAAPLSGFGKHMSLADQLAARSDPEFAPRSRDVFEEAVEDREEERKRIAAQLAGQGAGNRRMSSPKGV